MEREASGRWWAGLSALALALAWPQVAWANSTEGLLALILTLIGIVVLMGLLAVLHLALSVYLLARSARARGSRWMWAHGLGAVLVLLPLVVASWGLLISVWGEEATDAALFGGMPVLTSTAALVLSGLVWRRWVREGRVTPGT